MLDYGSCLESIEHNFIRILVISFRQPNGDLDQLAEQKSNVPEVVGLNPTGGNI